MSWETYFMSIAVLSSFRSKDKKTQNGACIVDPDRKIIGIGYNGLPAGCSDDDQNFWQDDNDDNILSSKHTYVVHAEKNAIYNCMAHNLKGATIYTTQFPCNTCAQAIIQVGIKNVVFLNRKLHKIHAEYNQAVEFMFTKANVKSECYKDMEVSDAVFLENLLNTGLSSFN